MLLAADELLVWRLYDWDLEEGVATGIFVFLADFHSSCCFNSFCKVSAALSRNGDGLFFSHLKSEKKKICFSFDARAGFADELKGRLFSDWIPKKFRPLRIELNRE